MPNINIQNLTFVYENRKKGEVVALNDLTCLFKSHSFNVIVGPSGCGKTTLLRIISGLEDEYEGDKFTLRLRIFALWLAFRNEKFILIISHSHVYIDMQDEEGIHNADMVKMY